MRDEPRDGRKSKSRRSPFDFIKFDAIRNLDAEMSVIGSLLLDGSRYDEVRTKLSSEDFYRDIHQEYYSAICELGDAGAEIDGVTVADVLERRGTFKAVGGNRTLEEIANCVAHAANVLYYADIVAQKARTRRIVETAHKVLEDAYSMQYPASELQARAEQAFYEAGGTSSDSNVKLPDEYINATLHNIAMRQAGNLTGIQSGWPAVDAITGGFADESMIVVAARPSMGKTSFALNIASHCTKEGLKVLFVSLEMNAAEIGERLLAAQANIHGELLRSTATLSPDHIIGLNEASEIVRSRPLHIDEGPTRSVAEIGSIARRQARTTGLDLLVVDYLQLITPSGDVSSRQEQVAGISRGLKLLAKQLKVPIIVMSQLNRLAEGRSDKRPMMSDLRESGAIEQDADIVILLHRPEYYDPNDQPGLAEIIVAKNRLGATGAPKLVFNKKIMQFDHFDPNQQYVYANTDGESF